MYLPSFGGINIIVKEIRETMAKAAKKMTSKRVITTKKVKKVISKPGAKVTRSTRKPVVPSFTAKTVKEITATFLDTMGLTAKIAAALAAENVNILAGTGYSASSIRRKATFTLIVNDLARAEKALEKIGADDIQESSVIMVETPNKVGALEKISRIIADAGINIYYFYSTTSSGKTATCIFKTADDKRAIKSLREV